MSSPSLLLEAALASSSRHPRLHLLSKSCLCDYERSLWAYSSLLHPLQEEHPEKVNAYVCVPLPSYSRRARPGTPLSPEAPLPEADDEDEEDDDLPVTPVRTRGARAK